MNKLKNILIIWAIVLGNFIFSEANENKTVVEGRYWTYLIKGSGGSTTENNFKYIASGYHFLGTQVFNGKEYNVFRDKNEAEVAYMREENNKVYLFINDKDLPYQVWDYTSTGTPENEVLIYDFSLSNNESFLCVAFDDMAKHFGIVRQAEVIDIGTISYDAESYYYQDFIITEDNAIEDSKFRNIEGIGNLRGFLPFPQLGNNTSGLGKETEYLLNITDAEGNVIFENSDIEDIPYLDKNLTWEYYNAYGACGVDSKYFISQYCLDDSNLEKYPFRWVCESSKKWIGQYREGEEFQDDNFTCDPEYIGTEILNSTQAYLREKNGIIYMSLNNYKNGNSDESNTSSNVLYQFDTETKDLCQYNPTEDDEVILYNFNAKVGDKYKSLIFGNIVCDVIVTDVNEEILPDLYGAVGEIADVAKVIKVIPECYLFYFRIANTESLSSEMNPWLEDYKIIYAEKIGNISKGNYISLLTRLLVDLDNGSWQKYLINNIYTQDGSTFYKGFNFQGFSNIKEIYQEKATDNNILDLHGREITNPQPGSIYIRNGKKFVAK